MAIVVLVVLALLLLAACCCKEKAASGGCTNWTDFEPAEAAWNDVLSRAEREGFWVDASDIDPKTGQSRYCMGQYAPDEYKRGNRGWFVGNAGGARMANEWLDLCIEERQRR